ncbi:hypothetical protein ACODGV_12285 [Vagococcus fluvialis]|uniref:hypothetical protein n=1 Tax=Vagococcus fluvialis TaxID=2738 RepID=UPI003B2190DF
MNKNKSLVGSLVSNNTPKNEETRTERIYPLVPKEMKQALKDKSEDLGVSLNEVYNQAFELYLNS